MRNKVTVFVVFCHGRVQLQFGLKHRSPIAKVAIKPELVQMNVDNEVIYLLSEHHNGKIMIGGLGKLIIGLYRHCHDIISLLQFKSIITSKINLWHTCLCVCVTGCCQVWCWVPGCLIETRTRPDMATRPGTRPNPAQRSPSLPRSETIYQLNVYCWQMGKFWKSFFL